MIFWPINLINLCFDVATAEIEVVSSNFTSQRKKIWTWHGIYNYLCSLCFCRMQTDIFWPFPFGQGLITWTQYEVNFVFWVYNLRTENTSKRDTLWHKTYPKKRECWRRTFHFGINISPRASKKDQKCLNALSSAFVNERERKISKVLPPNVLLLKMMKING